jgi:hypothetical protein
MAKDEKEDRDAEEEQPDLAVDPEVVPPGMPEDTEVGDPVPTADAPAVPGTTMGDESMAGEEDEEGEGDSKE